MTSTLTRTQVHPRMHTAYDLLINTTDYQIRQIAIDERGGDLRVYGTNHDSSFNNHDIAAPLEVMGYTCSFRYDPSINKVYMRVY